MTTCRNPECRNGFTPGVIAAGRGNSKIPIVGATMRWGWVNCRACSPKDKDPAFVLVNRTPQEVQERARMADSKATYDHAKAAQVQLQAIKAATPAPTAPTGTASATDAKLDRLLAQNEKLTDQVTELLAENRELHRKLESRAIEAVVVKPQRRRRSSKGESDDTQTGSKDKRSLS